MSSTDRVTSSPNAWLHRYAVLFAVCTGILVFAGGLVTSTGSGLSVPDWPLAEHPAEVTSGSASLSSSTVTLANTEGVRYTDKHTGVSLSLEAIHGQSTGYEFDHSPFMEKVDPANVGEKATFFAVKSDNGKEIATGEYDILLSPLASGELLGNVFVPALSDRNVHAGRSRLAQSLGESITDPLISKYDDPLIKKASASMRWDAEGTPTYRVDFIKEGTLKTFAYDLKTAYRYGKMSTGSAVRGGFGGLPSIGHHTFIVDGKRGIVDDERVRTWRAWRGKIRIGKVLSCG